MTSLDPASPQPRKRVGVYAGLYVRISDDREGAGLGVKRQEKDCRALADRLGWDVIDVYVDNDLSAYTGRPRASYNRMLDDVRSGRVDSILVWHNDRLHRHPIELEAFIKLLEEQRVPVQTVKAGEFDLATPSGRLVARVLGAAARAESEHKAERIKRKHEELAAAGASTGGGYRPYGYVRIFDRPDRPHKLIREELVPDEAAIIREATRRALALEDISSIVRDFNNRGVPTSGGEKWNARRVGEWADDHPQDALAREINKRRRGGEEPSDIGKDLNRRGVACPIPGRWSPGTLTRLLCSARIAGLREHRPRSRGETKRVVIGEITGKGNWPAIISAADSQRLRLLLTQDSRRTTPGPKGKHLCAGGVLFCGLCRRRMYAKALGANGRRQYRCDGSGGRTGCGRCSIDGDGTDEVVIAWVVNALSDSGLRDALERRRGDGADDADLLGEIAVCKQELTALAGDLGAGRITRAEWLAAREPLTGRLERAKGRLERGDTTRVLEGVPADRDGLEGFLTDVEVPVSRRRAVIFTVLERVWVGAAVPGRNRFDPDRLDPEWRA